MYTVTHMFLLFKEFEGVLSEGYIFSHFSIIKGANNSK